MATQSLYLYLQKMTELPEQNLDVNDKFLQGLFVVRRTVLVGSLNRPGKRAGSHEKSTGGLTRGKGMLEAAGSLGLV